MFHLYAYYPEVSLSASLQVMWAVLYGYVMGLPIAYDFRHLLLSLSSWTPEIFATKGKAQITVARCMELVIYIYHQSAERPAAQLRRSHECMLLLSRCRVSNFDLVN
jgi:hypothetical protein